MNNKPQKRTLFMAVTDATAFIIEALPLLPPHETAFISRGKDIADELTAMQNARREARAKSGRVKSEIRRNALVVNAAKARKALAEKRAQNK